jgi:hypothetical protein
VVDEDLAILIPKRKKKNTARCGVCGELVNLDNAYAILPFSGTTHMEKEKSCLDKAMSRVK